MSSPPAPAEEEGRAPTKYVRITGGVVSGLGKGVTASSIGVVLKACGLRVTCIKIGTRSSLPPPLCEVVLLVTDP
jgi:CTP synthase